MNQLNEILITTGKAARSSFQIWGWEVPVYLFLGGITAGVMVIAAWMVLKGKDEEYPVSTNMIILAAPVLITLGMGALFLDLSHKLYVWRFYTAFRITSVMSWGAWILLLVYPLSILLIASTFRKGYSKQYGKIMAWIGSSRLAPYAGRVAGIFDFAEKYKSIIAKANIPVGVLLGIYTGILLSSFGARPFWSSAILGPLFLVSGVSTGAALIILFAKTEKERAFFTKVDLGLIAVELFMVILFIIGMLTSSRQHMEAADLILGGAYTPAFWVGIFGIALLIPAFFELLELKGKHVPALLASGFVLFGGFLLRFIIVDAGQVSAWLKY